MAVAHRAIGVEAVVWDRGWVRIPRSSVAVTALALLLNTVAPVVAAAAPGGGASQSRAGLGMQSTATSSTTVATRVAAPSAQISAATVAAAARGALQWSAKTCRPDVREAAYDLPRPALVECARMQVPLDRARPSRGTIIVMITRVRSSAPSRSTRTLFVNPGGPGVEAGWLAPALAARMPVLHRSHTIVAVDPRGTGGSTPLDCGVVMPSVGEVRSPSSAALADMRAATASTVKHCAAAHGRVLPYISTAATVTDLDAVRARLGASTIDWYGVSAGTWLGARYAQAYPRRIGRLVLDSTVDVTSTWRASFAEQPRGFQRRYDRHFLQWVARHNRQYGLGTTPTAVRTQIEAVRRQAARGRLGGLAPVDIDAMIAEGLYDDTTFPDRAEDLAILADGASARQLKQIEKEAEQAWDPGEPGAPARALRAPQGLMTAEDTVFMAVQCNDFAWSKAQASYAAEGKALGTAYPLIGWTWSTSPCATWPYRPTPMPALRAHSLPAGMMLQNELDPATPWEGARRVWRSQKNLKVVAVDDEGNHGVLFSGNSCAVKRASDYLTKGTLPRADVVCAGRPLYLENRTWPIGRVLTPSNLD